MLSCFLSALCSRLIMSWVMMTCLVLVQLRNLAHSPQNRYLIRTFLRHIIAQVQPYIDKHDILQLRSVQFTRKYLNVFYCYWASFFSFTSQNFMSENKLQCTTASVTYVLTFLFFLTFTPTALVKTKWCKMAICTQPPYLYAYVLLTMSSPRNPKDSPRIFEHLPPSDCTMKYFAIMTQVH